MSPNDIIGLPGIDKSVELWAAIQFAVILFLNAIVFALHQIHPSDEATAKFSNNMAILSGTVLPAVLVVALADNYFFLTREFWTNTNTGDIAIFLLGGYFWGGSAAIFNALENTLPLFILASALCVVHIILAVLRLGVRFGVFCGVVRNHHKAHEGDSERGLGNRQDERCMPLRGLNGNSQPGKQHSPKNTPPTTALDSNKNRQSVAQSRPMDTLPTTYDDAHHLPIQPHNTPL